MCVARPLKAGLLAYLDVSRASDERNPETLRRDYAIVADATNPFVGLTPALKRRANLGATLRSYSVERIRRSARKRLPNNPNSQAIKDEEASAHPMLAMVEFR